MKKISSTNITIHPRAIESMGADLVTSDYVAILELVKNSYDACASTVKIEIGANNEYISIQDNGNGMSATTIENTWAMVATPDKLSNPFTEFKGIKRAVSGNKGLGRLSAARLGNILEIYTKQIGQPTIYAKFIWNQLYSMQKLEDCTFDIYEVDDLYGISENGTLIKISQLKTIWDEDNTNVLKDELKRLLNPFKDRNEKFDILFKNQNEELNLFNYNTDELITIQEFIQEPPYMIKGVADKDMNVIYQFSYFKNFFDEKKKILETISGKISWEEIKNLAEKDSLIVNPDAPCGEFLFEIRIWELSKDYLDEISNKYRLKAKYIRKVIEQHKGISIYRDNILVMPKSDSSKDWLGLDKRRISQIGRRLSTSQIIGVIDITSEKNPNIGDTTNRETFKVTPEYENFYAICYEGIIREVQNLRLLYKEREEQQTVVSDIFKDISPKELRNKVSAVVERKGDAIDVKRVVDSYSEKLEKNIDKLKERMEYYAQLASAGTFSKLIIHELRHNVNPMLRFARYINEEYSPFSKEKIQRSYDQAIDGSNRLIELSDIFSPLSRREFKKEKHYCNLCQQINYTFRLLEDSLVENKITVIKRVDPSYNVSLHPGEIQTVLINIIDNALYWIKKQKSDGIIEITAKVEDKFIVVTVNDNGTGVLEELKERIFEPGVTTKIGGFGMGLVVANELIASHGGYLKNIQPGYLGGATFEMSLPIHKGEEK